VRAAMVTAGAPGTMEVTVSTTTHKVRIDLAGKGALNLLWQTGLNAHVSIGPTLGYRGDADDVGATFYAGDDALFTSADESELLRVDADGFVDDASGTYTGTPAALIVKGADMMRHTWRAFLGQPEVDLASFVAMRTVTPLSSVTLSAYLGALAAINEGQSGLVMAGTFFATIANSNAAQFQFDGAGTLYYNPRIDTAPSSAPTIPETHYLSFEGYFGQDETYGTVRLNHSQDPTTGLPQGAEATRVRTVKGNRRTQRRTFNTYLTNDTDAQALLPFFVAQSRAPLRHMPVAIMGRAMRLKLGDMFKLNRTRGLRGVGETTLVGSEFRAKSKKTWTNHMCEVTGHTSVVD
jgi:hypothetical protein